jgi:hypothetical protein
MSRKYPIQQEERLIARSASLSNEIPTTPTKRFTAEQGLELQRWILDPTSRPYEDIRDRLRAHSAAIAESFLGNFHLELSSNSIHWDMAERIRRTDLKGLLTFIV